MSINGELRVVEHVPRAFAALVVDEAPTSLALSGGSTARACYELLAAADEVALLEGTSGEIELLEATLVKVEEK